MVVQMNNANKLPEKMSQLVGLAASDMLACVKDPDYKLVAGEWNNPRVHNTHQCCVCVAGSVMAKTLKVSNKKQVFPSNLNRNVQDKLYALDALRIGHFKVAFQLLGVTPSKKAFATMYETYCEESMGSLCWFDDTSHGRAFAYKLKNLAEIMGNFDL